MKRPLPPLVALEAFEAAARHENFALAATELAVSQSTISHRVRALEAHLGSTLFERLPRGVRLTDTGQAYLPSVRGAFEQIIGSTAGVFGTPGADTLTVRAPISYAALWLPAIVDRFLADHPDVRFKITTSVWSENRPDGDTDIDIRLGRGDWPSLDVDLLFTENLVAVAHPETVAALAGDDPVDALVSQPFVHLMGGEDLWSRFLTAFDVVRPPRHEDLRVDSAVAAIELARRSGRVAAVQHSLVEPYLASGDLALAVDHQVESEEGLYVAEARSRSHPRPEQVLFRQWLLADQGADRMAAVTPAGPATRRSGGHSP